MTKMPPDFCRNLLFEILGLIKMVVVLICFPFVSLRGHVESRKCSWKNARMALSPTRRLRLKNMVRAKKICLETL